MSDLPPPPSGARSEPPGSNLGGARPEPPGSRWSRAALASFVLGLASVFLVQLIVTGLPALYLGLQGLRAVNRSDGRLRGRRLAQAGMVLGGLGTLITVLGIATIIFLHLNRDSQRAECFNNLRRIGQALQRYQEAHKSFPPAGLPAPGLAPEQRLSWMAGIVPYLGEGKSAKYLEGLAGQLVVDKPWNDPANRVGLTTPIRVFQCPAHQDFASRTSPATTNYVGLAGINPDAIDLPRSSPRAGMFGYDRGVRLSDIVSGISYTIAVTEMAEADRPWLASGLPTTRGVNPNETHYIGPDRPFGGIHPDGAYMLYADTHVFWMNNKVAANVFRPQVTLSGRDSAP